VGVLRYIPESTRPKVIQTTHTKVSIAPEGFNEERTSQVEESEGVYEYDETYHTKAFEAGSGVVYKTKR